LAGRRENLAAARRKHVGRRSRPRDQGRSIAIGRNTLGKRLREKGWLIDMDKTSFTKVVNIGEGTARVFVFSKSRLFPSCEKGSEGCE
jgi:hypothetical protein